MGYTHYIRGKGSSDAEKNFDVFKDCVKQVIKNEEAKGVEFANGHGEAGTHPVFEDDYISFNGVGEHSHETCHIRINTNEDFNFCKTSRKIYDDAVINTYCLAHLLLGFQEPSSDGGDEVVQLAMVRAREVYESVTGKTMEVKTRMLRWKAGYVVHGEIEVSESDAIRLENGDEDLFDNKYREKIETEADNCVETSSLDPEVDYGIYND